MPKLNYLLLTIMVGIVAYYMGRLTGPVPVVKADAADAPQMDVRQIGATASLVVTYPSLKRMYVYQPFAGAPTWPCQFSIEISTPGGKVVRKQCDMAE